MDCAVRTAIVLVATLVACSDGTLRGAVEAPSLADAGGKADADDASASGASDASATADGGLATRDGGADVPIPDAGPTDAGPADAGLADAGPADAGPADAGPADAGPPDAGVSSPLSVLVFTRTEGFRHSSIGAAVTALEAQATARGWRLERTEETDAFTAERLAALDVVVFLCTTGDVLDGPEEAALEAFVRAGGGWVGVHSATDTEYDWPFYGELAGTWFERHPAVQEAEVIVETPDHPSTAHLGDPWTRRDEWYDFQTNPRQDVTVLLTVDESTYNGGGMGEDHPIAWAHENLGGRAFYTAGGHTADSYRDEDFITHVALGIEWAAGRR